MRLGMTDFRKECEDSAREPNNILATGRENISENVFWNIPKDIIDKLALNRTDIVLDIGCAHGLYDTEFGRLSRLVIGIDYSKEFLHRARRNVENHRIVRVVGGDARGFPFKNGIFTKMVCYNVFHYFGDLGTVRDVLGDIKRVCKPGAIVFIGDLPNLGKRRLYLRRKISREAAERSFSTLRRVISPLNQKILKIMRVGEIPWHYRIQWFDPELLLRIASELGMSGEILQQQDYIPSHYYRFDLRLTVK